MNSIGEKCPQCGIDNWHIKDDSTMYIKICMNCYHIEEIHKQDYIKKFECPDCGSLSGTIEENDEKLGVRCNNCGKLYIKLEKKGVTWSTRNNPQAQPKANIPHCPTCNSTNIEKISATSKLMGAIGFGLFSKTARSQFRCKDCGYKW